MHYMLVYCVSMLMTYLKYQFKNWIYHMIDRIHFLLCRKSSILFYYNIGFLSPEFGFSVLTLLNSMTAFH